MLVTDDADLAQRAREFSSLGYRLAADQPRIDSATLKSPTFARHHGVGFNYRMNDLTATVGLTRLRHADRLLSERADCAAFYRDAVEGCAWLTPQQVPEGWTHDYWTYAVACDTPERALGLAANVVRFGGEQPYPAWLLTYREPAFWHLPDGPASLGRDGPLSGVCPVAESLQPRLLQFQTNNLASAERNAHALRAAITASA